jgi:hypothetical protein
MDNNSITDINAITNNLNSSPSLGTSSTNNSSSILDGLKSISWTTWLIIILIFSFLGFNVFVYLAEGTQNITDILKPLFGKILLILGLATKEVVDITAEGTRSIAGGAKNVIDQTTTTIQNAVDKPFEQAKANKQANSTTPSTASSSVKGNQFEQPPVDIMQNNTLNKALNTSAAVSSSQEYEADDSSSSIQHGGSKSGWCFIGEDRGFRTCAEVGVNDSCMSGNIFPSQEICINPNLRP